MPSRRKAKTWLPRPGAPRSRAPIAGRVAPGPSRTPAVTATAIEGMRIAARRSIELSIARFELGRGSAFPGVVPFASARRIRYEALDGCRQDHEAQEPGSDRG